MKAAKLKFKNSIRVTVAKSILKVVCYYTMVYINNLFLIDSLVF